MEVNNDTIIILTDMDETASEIDAAPDRAQKRLRQLDKSVLDRERAQAALQLPRFACKLRQNGQAHNTYGNMSDASK